MPSADPCPVRGPSIGHRGSGSDLWIRAIRVKLGDPEVQHLGVTAVGHEEVGGFDVAVDDAFTVRGAQRIRDLGADRQDTIHRHRPAANFVLERRALEQLHRDERLAVVLADVVNRADVGMVERGGRPRFTRKSRECLIVARLGDRQKLERDLAAQPRVLSAIDDAHPSTAEELHNAVVRDGLADHADGRVQVQSSKFKVQS